SFHWFACMEKALHRKPCINSYLEAPLRDQPASISATTVTDFEELPILMQGYFITISTQPLFLTSLFDQKYDNHNYLSNNT
ncbi:hypothetical protein, partial [Roseibium sp. RKSG952]|uniref:hypothetical protein n=1 Tax=Roseibium sp. RKSG952 TaxID=2529384 RepID=UPI001AD93185